MDINNIVNYARGGATEHMTKMKGDTQHVILITHYSVCDLSLYYYSIKNTSQCHIKVKPLEIIIIIIITYIL